MASLRSPLASLLLPSALLFAACEVGGTGDTGTPNPGSPDAGTVERNCAVPESHLALGDLGGAATSEPQEVAGTLYRLNADIDPASPKDVMSILLYDDKGGFTGPVAPGTITIGGDDTNFNTCGACVTIVADIVPMVGPTELYIAQSGTLQIDSVTPTLSGQITDLVLAEFDLATGAPLADGCQTTIDSASFSATVAQ